MRRVLLVAAVAVAAVVAWWQVRVEGSIWVDDLNILNFDTYAYYRPMFEYGFAHVRRGEFPWWNPYQLCGTPFFATGQHLLLYPFAALYWVLPTTVAMKWTSILHYVLAILFTFCLARVLGLSRIAGLIAGIVFALGGSVVGLLYIPHHLYGAAWIPLVLALAHLAWTTRQARWTLALGVAAACQYLGGYPVYALFSAYLIAGYVLAAVIGDVLDGRGVVACMDGVALLGLAAAIALALAAVQLLPAAELAGQSPRAFGALRPDTADPSRLQPYTSPWMLLQGLVVPPQQSGLPAYGAVGLLALTTACCAPFHAGRRRATLYFLAVAILGWLLAFGGRLPVYPLYYRLPTGSWFRLPPRFIVPASLAIAMLTGIGFDFLADPRRARWPALALLVAVGLLVVWRLDDVVNLRSPGIHLAVAGVWLAAHELVRGRRAQALLGVLLVGLVYAELWLAFVNIVPIPETDPHYREMPSGVVDYLRAHQGFDRTYLVTVPLTGGHIRRVPLKAGMMYGLFTVADHENVYASRYQDYIDRLEGSSRDVEAVPQAELHATARSPNLRLLDLMGARFIVDGRDANFLEDTDATRFPTLYRGGDVRVLENRAALPRAFLVGAAEVIREPVRILDRLVEPGFDPRGTVVLEEAPSGGPWRSRSGAPGRAEIVAYAPEQVTVRTRADAPALLVLTDQYYPGWTATVDGATRPILRADYLFRAVALPAGAHEVVFRFRPTFLRALLPGS